MNTQKILGVVVLVVVLVLGVTFPRGKNGETVVQQVLGAVASLDNVDNPYTSIGGVRSWNGAVGLTATSSAICAIKNPYSATSTVVRAGLRTTNGISGANNVSLSTSTNNYATSSQFLVLDATLTASVPTSVYWNFGVATTANSRLLINADGDGQSNVILKAGEYLVWRLATTTGAGALEAYYQGTCSAEIYEN